MHDALAYHSDGDDSDNAIGTIFISDEINRVPNVFFSRERCSCRYIIRLVKRDIDRFARLIDLSSGHILCYNIP